MNTNITIRFAGAEDINIIGFLAQEIWPPTYREILSEDQLNYMMDLIYSPASLKNQILEKKHTFIIIEEVEMPVGFASYSITNQQDIYKLHKIYVMSNQQGKGLGKFIIDFIAGNIQQQGALALQLNVNRHNKARYFYEKIGFKIISEEDIDIGNNYFMNDYIMEMKIS